MWYTSLKLPGVPGTRFKIAKRPRIELNMPGKKMSIKLFLMILC